MNTFILPAVVEGGFHVISPELAHQGEELANRKVYAVMRRLKEANSKVTHRRTGIVLGGSRWMRVQNNLKSETWSEPAA